MHACGVQNFEYVCTGFEIKEKIRSVQGWINLILYAFTEGLNRKDRI